MAYGQYGDRRRTPPSGGRGGGPYGRERSMSPPLRRRGSPEYGPMNGSGGGGYGGGYGGGGRGGGGTHGRRGRDDFGYRGGSPPLRDGRMGGPRGDHGGPRDRPNYDRGGDRGAPYSGAPYGRDRGFRDRHFRDREFNDYDRDPRYSPDLPRSPGYTRGGPARDDGPAGDSKEPMSKTMFIKTKIDGDIPEEEVDRRYDEYLAHHWKSKHKAEFEKQKNNDEFRQQFDPFVLKTKVLDRAQSARTVNVKFGQDFKDGKYDWQKEGLQQLMTPEEWKKATAVKPPTPPVAWLPEVVGFCWRLAVRLILKLDDEKNILFCNHFDWMAPEQERLQALEANDEDGDGADNDAEEGEGKEEKAKGGAAAAEADILQGEAPSGDELHTRTGQLDVMLEYLWAVHGVDFYAGAELDVELWQKVQSETDPSSRESRTVRCMKPQSGSGIDERKRDSIIETFHTYVTRVWIARLGTVDPDTEKVGELEKLVDASVQAALQGLVAASKKEDDNYSESDGIKLHQHARTRNGASFNCKFCSKRFKGEMYLVKHMYSRHKEEIDAMRKEEEEKLYFDNFKKAKERQVEEEAPPPGPEPHMPPAHMMMMPPGMMPFQPMPPYAFGMMPRPMPYGPGPYGPPVPRMDVPPMPGRGRGRGPRPPDRPPPGRGSGFQYFDLDNPSNDRMELNYGDI